MKYYFALVEPGEGDTAFGIRFPDLPAVYSAADSEADVYAQATEALQLFAEDVDDSDMPEASDLAALSQLTDVKEDLARGAFFARIPFVRFIGKVTNKTVSGDAAAWAVIDAAAKASGVNRSAFLVTAALEKAGKL